MRISLYILTLLIVSSQRLHPRPFEFNDQCRQAYLHIIALRFDEGKTLILEETLHNPDNLIPLVLENYIDFLKVFISEDKDVFNELYANRTARLNELSQGEASSPYYNWSLAMVNLHWAFARLKFGEQFAAAREIRRAFLLLEENERRFSGFVPNQIGLGLLQALVGSIPPQYQWVARMASMHGTVPAGRERLYAVLDLVQEDQSFQYLTNETLFFLAFIEMNLMPDREGVYHLLSHLGQADGYNLLMAYIRANMQMSVGRNEEAIHTLINRPQGDAYYPFHYLDYLLADAFLRKLETDKAEKCFLQFLDRFRGINYRQDALRKLAWIGLLRGNEREYHQLMKLVTNTTPGQVDADKQAARETSMREMPNPLLLKTRLLFDGGYYSEALGLALEGETRLSGEHQLEYAYRLGRIYHESWNNSQAIFHYIHVIELGKNNPAYYAANAALKLGDIYETNGQHVLAMEYYRACLGMRPDEYRTSIHQKARAGISRLSGK